MHRAGLWRRIAGDRFAPTRIDSDTLWKDPPVTEDCVRTDGNDQPPNSTVADHLCRVLGDVPRRWLVVNVEKQRLQLIVDGVVVSSYGVSTAFTGVDGREGSFGTPPGVHRIARRIGAQRPCGTWFVSREPQGKVWRPGDDGGDDLILSRILTLDGCEDGVNRGAGCDSLQRFIYIHGTNHEDRIGEPVSRGCIRMSNTDVIHLFDQVEEGDPVVVV